MSRNAYNKKVCKIGSVLTNDKRRLPFRTEVRGMDKRRVGLNAVVHWVVCGAAGAAVVTARDGNEFPTYPPDGYVFQQILAATTSPKPDTDPPPFWPHGLAGH